MAEQRSNILQFRRSNADGQVRLPLGHPAHLRPARPPMDDRRIAHRRRMLEFLRGQSLGAPTVLRRLHP